MKKILLGTSALIGAATLLAGAAFAEDPKVTVGGFNTFEAGYTSSDADQGLSNRSFRNNTEIHFNVAGKNDSGLGYGAEIDLNADIDGANNLAGSTNSGLNAHRTYGWLQGDQWGHVEFGSNDGAARTLKVDASNIARASGGIDGDWSYFADANVASGSTGTGSAGVLSGKFITAPRLTAEHGAANYFAAEGTSNHTKVTYYTPRFQGLQLGVSYAPSLNSRGQNNTRILSGDASDVFSGGVNYEEQFDQIGVAAAVTGETAKSKNKVVNGQNINAWNAGAKVSYQGFSLAGSYGDWTDSLDVKDAEADYWTVGAAYETGPVGSSVTYLSSQNKSNAAGGFDNEFQNISVGVDYKLAAGLTPFVEYTWYDLNPNASANDNTGNVVLVGSQLSF